MLNKMKFTKSKIVGFIFLSIALVGCSDKEKGTDDGPEIPETGSGSGSMSEMSATESKTFLTDVSTEVMNYFNPDDQKELVEQVAYFMDRYGGYDMPEEFIDIEDDDDWYGAPAKYFSLLLRAGKGDSDALARSSYYYTYTLNFERFAGVYTPNSKYKEWRRTGNSENIEFIFDGFNGTQCSLVVTKSGDESKINITITDDDWYDKYVDEYKLSIPQNVKTTFKAGSKVLATADVTSTINVSGHTISLNATASVCNLKATAIVSGDDTKIAGETKFYVNDKQLAYAYAKINGNDLCNKEKVQELIENEFEDRYMSRMLTDGECKGDVLGKVQLYGEITYYNGLFEDLDGYWGSWDYTSKSAAEKDCKKAVERLNLYTKEYLCYNNTATQQATLKFKSLYDSYESYYYSWWEYSLGTQLVFPDGTTYDVDSYFERFTTVSNKFESLIDAYERVWDNAI